MQDLGMGKVKEIFHWKQFHRKIGGFETSTQTSFFFPVALEWGTLFVVVVTVNFLTTWCTQEIPVAIQTIALKNFLCFSIVSFTYAFLSYSYVFFLFLHFGFLRSKGGLSMWASRRKVKY
jgi:hypothetical protein